jgi:hypothetical protein
MDSNAFSESKHQYHLPRFALRYLSTDVLIITTLPTGKSGVKSRMHHTETV